LISLEENDGLVKLHLNLPNHWKHDGESLWALSLGDDLYEIRSTPFCAYGLNWGDVVRAMEERPDYKPEIIEVVKLSGHRTLRIYFATRAVAEQEVVLNELNALGVCYERADEEFVTLDVELGADYDLVCERLRDLTEKGILDYETCEARIDGSFDDVPDAG